MSEAAIKEGQEGPFNGYLLTPYNGIVPFLYVRMSSAHTATQRNAWYCLGQRRNGRAVRIYPPAEATMDKFWSTDWHSRPRASTTDYWGYVELL